LHAVKERLPIGPRLRGRVLSGQGAQGGFLWYEWRQASCDDANGRSGEFVLAGGDVAELPQHLVGIPRPFAHASVEAQVTHGPGHGVRIECEVSGDVHLEPGTEKLQRVWQIEGGVDADWNSGDCIECLGLAQPALGERTGLLGLSHVAS